MSSDATDAARLVSQLIHAHWSNSKTAETAALDQIQAFLSPERTRQARAQAMTWQGVHLASSTLRAMAMAAGKIAPVWQLDRCTYAHRADVEACELVIATIEAELNQPGMGAGCVGIGLVGRDADGCLAVVREAIWQAATAGTRCVIV